MAAKSKIQQLKNSTIGQPISVRNYLDEAQNKVVAKFYPKIITLSLKLATERRQRNLGQITRSTKTIWIRRKRGRHLHIKTNSYGFNSFILSHAKTFDTVRLSDEDTDWVIPVSFILERGTYLFHKQSGFERQVFVKLNEIEQFKLPKDNDRRF